MPVLETLTLLYEGYQIGGKIGNVIFNGEHTDELERASNLYNAIDTESDGNEEALREVLDCLTPITAADKAWVWAAANFLRALCCFHLNNYKQARYFISNVLGIEEDTFTVNKDVIKDRKEGASILLQTCIFAETLSRIPDYDEETVTICKGIADILVENLAYRNSFTGSIDSLRNFGIEAWEVPFFLDRIEEKFDVSFKDEKLLGVSRKDLIGSFNDDVKYNDIDIAELVMGIRAVNNQDEDEDTNLRKQVLEIIGEVLGEDVDVINGTDSLVGDLECDELDFVELLMEIEERFGVMISDDDLKQYGVSFEKSGEDIHIILPKDFTVDDLVSLVIEHIPEEDLNEDDLSKEECDYLEMYKEYASDGDLSERDRKMLDKFRIRLGISEERAQELEASCSEPELSEDEQEYLEMFKEYASDGEITARDRKMLNKMRDRMGISEERAKEIEEL